jgi:hypothetical protein
LQAELSAGTELVVDEPEQIDVRAEAVIAGIRAKATNFILNQLQAIPPRQEPTVSGGLDESEKFCNVAKVVLGNRAGVEVDKKELLDAQKNGFMGMGLQGFCREFLNRSGVRHASSLSGQQIYDELCKIRPTMAAASQGSGDFANVLADVAHKSLAKAWESSPTTYQAWTGSDVIQDFRPKNIVRISETGDIQEIQEGEGFSYTSMSDSKESVQLSTYGVAFGLSRKALVNDDLGALTDAPAKIVRSVRRKINRLCYAGLYGTAMTGPTMGEDNGVMFSTTHKNYVASGSGAAPSTTTLATLRQKLMKQVLPSPDGGQSETQYTNIAPRFIVYHSNHDIVVNQLITSTYDISTTGSLATQMPFIKGLIPVWDPVLDELMDKNTHAGWYLLADPADGATVSVFSLTGQTSPTLRQKISDVGEPLGIAWDVYIDVGIGFPDYRYAAANFGK